LPVKTRKPSCTNWIASSQCSMHCMLERPALKTASKKKADKILIDSLCSKNSNIEQHLVETLTKSEQKVMQKISGVEQELKNKAETNLLQTAEDRIKQLEDKPNAAEEVKNLAATVEIQRTDNHELRDSVQDAVRDKLQEYKEEADDLQ